MKLMTFALIGSLASVPAFAEYKGQPILVSPAESAKCAQLAGVYDAVVANPQQAIYKVGTGEYRFVTPIPGGGVPQNLAFPQPNSPVKRPGVLLFRVGPGQTIRVHSKYPQHCQRTPLFRLSACVLRQADAKTLASSGGETVLGAQFAYDPNNAKTGPDAVAGAVNCRSDGGVFEGSSLSAGDKALLILVEPMKSLTYTLSSSSDVRAGKIPVTVTVQ